MTAENEYQLILRKKAASHLDLVTIKFRELNPERWDRERRGEKFGHDDVGLIPLEISIGLVQERLLELESHSIVPVIVPVIPENKWKLLGKPINLFRINDRNGDIKCSLYEIDGVLYIPNFSFDNFMEFFSGNFGE